MQREPATRRSRDVDRGDPERSPAKMSRPQECCATRGTESGAWLTFPACRPRLGASRRWKGLRRRDLAPALPAKQIVGFSYPMKSPLKSPVPNGVAGRSALPRRTSEPGHIARAASFPGARLRPSSFGDCRAASAALFGTATTSRWTCRGRGQSGAALKDSVGQCVEECPPRARVGARRPSTDHPDPSPARP